MLSRWRSHVEKGIIKVWTLPCGSTKGCQWDQEFHVFLFNICTKRCMEEWGLWQHVFILVLGGFLCQGTWPSFSNFLFFCHMFAYLLILFWGFVCLWLFICLFLFCTRMYFFAVEGSGAMHSRYLRCCRIRQNHEHLCV